MISIIIFLIVLIFACIPNSANAQTQQTGYVLTATSTTSFGWYPPIAATWGIASTGSLPINIAVDSNTVMSIQRAQRSIDSLNASINLKLNISGFTKAAMVGLGMLAYTDTSGMLSPYLRSNVAAATYLTNIPAQSFASITGKPTTLSGYSITDAYPLSGNPSSFLTSASISGKVNVSDTAGMLATYLRSNIAAATYATISNLALKVNIGDTANMLNNYARKNYYTGGTGIGIAGNVITNTSPDQTVSITGGTGVSVSGTYPSFTVANTAPYIAPTFNNSPARLLSTTGSDNTFTISTTKNAHVHYTVNFAFALTLTTSNGYVELDYSVNAGSTWVIAGSVSNVYSLSVSLSGNADNQLNAEIPANALCRLYRINNTNVTITLPTTKQEEVTY